MHQKESSVTFLPFLPPSFQPLGPTCLPLAIELYYYISRCDSLSLVILIEIIPHPKIRGHWLVKSLPILPYPIWYTNKEDAVSYAEWLAAGREAEIKDP